MTDHSNLKLDPELQKSSDLRYGECMLGWSGEQCQQCIILEPLKQLHTTLSVVRTEDMGSAPTRKATGSALIKASAGYMIDPDYTGTLLVLLDWPEAS